MMTGVSGFGFFVQKWPFRDTQICFPKHGLLNPYFHSVLGGAFLGQVVKTEKFWTPTKNENFD